MIYIHIKCVWYPWRLNEYFQSVMIWIHDTWSKTKMHIYTQKLWMECRWELPFLYHVKIIYYTFKYDFIKNVSLFVVLYFPIINMSLTTCIKTAQYEWKFLSRVLLSLTNVIVKYIQQITNVQPKSSKTYSYESYKHYVWLYTLSAFFSLMSLWHIWSFCKLYTVKRWNKYAMYMYLQIYMYLKLH